MYAKALLIGAASAATATQATLDSNLIMEEDYKFMQYITEHSKHYATKAEFQFRSKIFKESLAEVEFHNSQNNTHRLEINFMADMTKDERKKLNGYKLRQGPQKNVEILDESNLAASVDWRQKGAVTPVKNQGQCGSCWSFSTTGAVEGANQIKTGKLQSFSEQQLVDCDKVDAGCNGGLMDNAFKFLESNPIDTEAAYPYKGRRSLRC
jgi:C1A family cysteine protease